MEKPQRMLYFLECTQFVQQALKYQLSLFIDLIYPLRHQFKYTYIKVALKLKYHILIIRASNVKKNEKWSDTDLIVI